MQTRRCGVTTVSIADTDVYRTRSSKFKHHVSRQRKASTSNENTQQIPSTNRNVFHLVLRVLVRAVSVGSSCPPTERDRNEWDNPISGTSKRILLSTVCSPCSHAHITHVITACVSSPRGWAASSGHVQQDVVISEALPRAGFDFIVL